MISQKTLLVTKTRSSLKSRQIRRQWNVVGWSLNERKRSIDKCSEVECSIVGWSVVKCSQGLSNKVSNIIVRYIDHRKVCCLYGFFVYHILSCSSVSIFFIIPYMVVCFVCFCLILWIMYFYFYVYVLYFYVYIFLLLCMFCSIYSFFIVLFYVLFVCKCVL